VKKQSKTFMPVLKDAWRPESVEFALLILLRYFYAFVSLKAAASARLAGSGLKKWW
jgi:hypothetical protein